MKIPGLGIKETAVKWIVGTVLTVAVGWLVKVNMTVVREPELRAELKTQHTVLDDVLVVVHRMDRFQRDSVMTVSDMKFLVKQQQGAHRDVVWRLEHLEGKPRSHIDRPRYYPEYGPMPEKMADWFEWYVDKGNK